MKLDHPQLAHGRRARFASKALWPPMPSRPRVPERHQGTRRGGPDSALPSLAIHDDSPVRGRGGGITSTVVEIRSRSLASSFREGSLIDNQAHAGASHGVPLLFMAWVG